MSDSARIALGVMGLCGVAWLYFAIVRPVNSAVDRHLERVESDRKARLEKEHLER